MGLSEIKGTQNAEQSGIYQWTDSNFDLKATVESN